MPPTKNLKGICSECGGSFLFPAEMVGTVAQCPRCGKQTELLLQIPELEPTIPRRMIVWTLVAAIILIGGVAGSMIALNRAQKLAASRKAPGAGQVATGTSNAVAGESRKVAMVMNGFEIGPIANQKTTQGSVRAVGTARNMQGQARRKVKITLELRDATGRAVGIAMDSTPEVAAGGEWRFEASVLVPTAVSTRVVSVESE